MKKKRSKSPIFLKKCWEIITRTRVRFDFPRLHQTPKAAFRLFWVFCLVCIVARSPPERLAFFFTKIYFSSCKMRQAVI